jgi:peptidoglycan/xylan/chitin deacetylase (PgdA/CDA1 family)
VTTLIPVLLYHSVDERAEPRDRRWTISPRDFASHLDVIADSGRSAMTVTQIAAALRGERPLPARPVGITFDDGFSDNYEAAKAIVARGLAATLYLTTGEIGRPDRLSLRQLAELAGATSIELGAHAVRHRRLDELDDRELALELEGSKARLEDIVQGTVDSFAYPHGAYDRRVRAAVVRAGYDSAAAVKNAVAHDRDDPFAIARWTVTAGTPARRIAEVLEGQAVPRAWSAERFRTRAYRAARRSRRELTRKVEGWR